MRGKWILCWIVFFILWGCATQQSQISKVPGVYTGYVAGIEQVTRDPAPEFFPRLSPDGRKLLFQVENLQEHGSKRWNIFLKNIGRPGRIFVIGPGAVSPYWFPDSQNFIFAYLKGGSSYLAISSIGSSSMTFLSAQPFGGDWDSRPSVSPDGKHIAFNTVMGGSYKICTVNIDGSFFTIYTEGKAPNWSPDGKKIVFYKKVGEYYQIFVLNLEKGTITQITFDESNHKWPCFSPDGNWIVFSGDRGGGYYHLFVVKTDGSKLTQLTKGNSDEIHPFWGVDGYIYFVSNAGSPYLSKPLKYPEMKKWRWKHSDI